MMGDGGGANCKRTWLGFERIGCKFASNLLIVSSTWAAICFDRFLTLRGLQIFKDAK